MTKFKIERCRASADCTVRRATLLLKFLLFKMHFLIFCTESTITESQIYILRIHMETGISYTQLGPLETRNPIRHCKEGCTWTLQRLECFSGISVVLRTQSRCSCYSLSIRRFLINSYPGTLTLWYSGVRCTAAFMYGFYSVCNYSTLHVFGSKFPKERIYFLRTKLS